jgi:hypothetical protein
MNKPDDKEVIHNFYRVVMRVAKEVVEEGEKMGHGFSMLEVKFKNGLPVITIQSHTQSIKYTSDDEAQIAIAGIITAGRDTMPKSSQTFTLVREGGDIKRILVDSYITDILQS